MKHVPLTITDSIAIEILREDAILTGVGNKVRLHSTAETSRELSMQLRGKVHGIESGSCADTDINADKLLVYGEKEFMLLRWTPDLQFQQLNRAQISDWISAARFLRNGREFVLLTAHSILLRFAYDEGSGACQIIERISCSDKSTLYCAHLHGYSRNELVVFGGNAFGELLIWQPPLAQLCESADAVSSCPLLQRIQMHNGVIFSIDYDARAQLLTTTSDDRSIKFWQVAFDQPALVNCQQWATSKLTPMASGYGHVARVFQGKIINYANAIYAITVGEDSYFCIWRSTGELLHKRRQQFGATIWNFAYEPAAKTLFTVGSTGNLLAYGLADVLDKPQLDSVTILPHIGGCTADAYVAKIKFLNNNLLIGVTNKNRLIYKRLVRAPEIDDEKWHFVDDFEPYKCTVLEVHEELIALCGYKRLTLYKCEPETAMFIKLYDGEILQNVVRAFQFLNSENFLISDELGNCLLLRGLLLQQRFEIELPKCKERWLTAALLVERNFLVVSNRQGNLMLYKFNETVEKYAHCDTLKHPHGNLGATKLKLVETTSESAYLKSSGHDGTIRVLCLDKDAAKLSVHAREIVPVAWVEDFFAMAENACGELLLGFNDNHFVVWSKRHDLALQVPCGGGHRCWHYAIFEDNAHCKWLQLAFIKNKEVRLHKLKLFNEIVSAIQLPQPQSWHVKACNIAEIVTQHGNKEALLISAGDDNLIKISGMRNDALVQHAEVHTHISNIRALKVKQINAHECLIFSGGGRAQLCVTKLNLINFKIEERLNYTLKPKLETQTHDYSCDPEMRLMSIDVLSQPPVPEAAVSSTFHIYLGCSDGYVRKLFLNEEFEIQTETALAYDKCVLQVRLIARQYVLLAATDGLLHFYDLELKKLLFSLRHHASGINALDVLHDAATNQLHLLTGGDDQSVVYSHIDCATPERAIVLKTLNLNGLHTAQVTAACLQRTKGVLFAFTSGVDQNLIKFNLSNEAQEVQRFHGCVADVKGVCLDASQRCFIYGCGLQTHVFESLDDL